VARIVSRGAGARASLVNRLCLALSCLLVQMRSVSAEGAFDSVLAAFPPGGAATLACVEILATLAEEAGNARTPIPSARREAFLTGLRARADAALSALQAILTAGAASGNIAWIERVFRCFGSWVAGERRMRGACTREGAVPACTMRMDAVRVVAGAIAIACLLPSLPLATRPPHSRGHPCRHGGVVPAAA